MTTRSARHRASGPPPRIMAVLQTAVVPSWWHHHHQKGGRGGYGRIRVSYTGRESGNNYSPNNGDVVSKAQISQL